MRQDIGASWVRFFITPLVLVVAAIGTLYVARSEIGYFDLSIGLCAGALCAAILWRRRVGVIVLVTTVVFLLIVLVLGQPQFSWSDMTAIVRGILLLAFGTSILYALPHWLSRQREFRALSPSNVTDGVVATDIDLKVTAWNRGAEAIYGWTAWEAIGRPFDEVGGPSFTQAERKDMGVRSEGTESINVQTKSRRRDGSEVWLETRTVRVTDASGTVTGFLIGVKDVAGIVQLSQDAIIRTLPRAGLAQRITLFNALAEKTFGYTEVEILGKPLQVLIPGRLRAVHDAEFQSFLESGEPARHLTFPMPMWGLRKDGGEFPLDIAVAKLNIDGEQIFIVHFRDITDEQRVEDELRQRAQQQEAGAYLGQLALSGGSLADLLDETAETVVRVLRVDFCRVTELMPVGDSFISRASIGCETNLEPEIPGSRADVNLPAAFTLQARVPVVIDDFRTETRFEVPRDITEAGLVSGVNVPILGLPEPFGVLSCGSHERRHFSENEINFLVAVAHIISTAVQRQRSEAELSSRARYQETVAGLGQTALSRLGLQTLLDEAGRTVSDILGLELCGVYELLAGGDNFFLRAGVGWPDGSVGTDTIPGGPDSQFGYALIAGEPVVVVDLPNETRFTPSLPLLSRGIVSGITTVIGEAGRPFGVLSGQTAEHRKFTEQDVSFLVAVANVLASAVERQRALEATERLAAIVETSSEAILTVDLDGKLLTWNPAAEASYGYTGDEIVGEPIDRICTAHSAAQMRAALQVVTQGTHVPNFESEQVSKSGEVHEASIAMSPIRDDAGKVIGSACIARDITNQKRAERELRESAERLHAVVRNAPVILFATNLEGSITFFEGRGIEDLGIPVTDVLGKPPPAGWMTPAFSDAMRSVFSGESASVTIEDNERLLEVFLSPTHGAVGPTGMIGVAIDVTEARRSEVLRVKLLAAEESARVATNLLGTVSHELRTPLTTVRGFASTIIDYGDQLSDEEKLSYVRSIDNAARHLENMVSDLLTLSRIDAGVLALEMRSLDVTSLVRAVASSFALGATKHKLEVSSPDSPVLIQGDMSRLRQVLSNLIDNALKYSPPDSRIEINVNPVGQQVEISVKDQGNGVPPESLEAIFEIFFRASTPATAAVSGTGLGLAICRGIVQAHGGRVWANLPIGGGFELVVSLPCAEAQEPLLRLSA